MTQANTKISYSYLIQIKDIHRHYFDVTLHLTSDKDNVNLCLPAWTPGSYMIRDYSTHLYQFTALDGKTNAELQWEQIGLHEWNVVLHGNSAVIKYVIYAFEDYTVRTNYLTTEFGFINPPAMFLYPKGSLNQSIQIQFDTSNFFSNIYTSLQKGSEDIFYANSFDDLYDSPFHLSNQNSIFFDTENCKHELIVEGSLAYSFKEKLAEDLKKICSAQIKAMGHSPNSYYLFILNLTQQAYGGLEHKASSVNYFSPDNLADEEEYKKLLELLSHEYFHLWNVKRIRPIALGPFDYQNPNLTKELWIAEGATSFYDIYFLYLSGLFTKDEFFSRLQSDVISLEDTDAQLWMSLEESSFTAWNKYYKRNGNSHNVSVSYYTKGAVLILCMVIYILKETSGKYSFLDILRSLYNLYYLEKDRGFTKQEFFDIAKKTTGVDLKIEFDQYLTKPNKIPTEKYLFWIGANRIDADEVSDLGFKVKERNGNLFINKLLHKGETSPIPELQLDDEILAINGIRMNKASFDRLEKQLKPKERIHILLARFGKTKEVMVEVGSDFKTKKFIFSPEIPSEIKLLQDVFFYRE